ncbi:type II secretion system F family protein [Lignipirellula cremea]|uniref:Bacterial type II secretion system protein F domain protein n=1 Tax=Lignipirellula cremea TaxID=2528010 RepID=A0A518E1J6_9BACT|nr:type II secretion system F family protein [Lignipirellula cremea]QDU97968.1 Bacterial type II secretion system protein F domain protein [Lignipirellula cremea]
MATIVIAIAAFVGFAALVGGVGLMLRGESGGALEDRLDVLTGSGPRSRDSQKSQSSVLMQPLDDMPSLVERWFSRVINLRLFLEQADAPLTPTKFLAVTGIAAAIGFLIVVVAPIHYGFAPLGALMMAFAPFTWLVMRRKRRLHAFAQQLPEALELLSRALRSGHSLAAGLNLVADEIPDPLGKEFGRCYEEQNFGIPLEEALEELTERVPNLDLRFFVTAIILQRTTGGDLAEILDKIGHLIRERFQILGQVQSLTGEGRLSGIVLLALPPVLFVVMYRLNAEYVMKLFTDPLGNRMLAAAVVMQFFGALVIRKIVNIKV